VTHGYLSLRYRTKLTIWKDVGTSHHFEIYFNKCTGRVLKGPYMCQTESCRALSIPKFRRYRRCTKHKFHYDGTLRDHIMTVHRKWEDIYHAVNIWTMFG